MNLESAFVVDNKHIKVDYIKGGEKRTKPLHVLVTDLISWNIGNNLSESFLKGFKGYDNMSLEEIRQEIENKFKFTDVCIYKNEEKRELEGGKDYELDIYTEQSVIKFSVKIKKDVNVKAVLFETVYVDELR